MNEFETAVKLATEASYEEDANHVVGIINGDWEIAHGEDMGRQAEMRGETFLVGSSGIIE